MTFFWEPRFWVVTGALAVLCLLYNLLTLQGSWRTFLASVVGPVAVVALLFVSRPIGDRLLPASRAGSGSDPATNVVFAIFSVVGTLVAGYAFYTVSRFSKQRRGLKRSIANAEAASSLAASQADLISTQYRLLQVDYGESRAQQITSTAQLTAFLDLQNRLRELGPLISMGSLNQHADLRLMESVLLRHEWSRIRFDLHEMALLAGRYPGRFRLPPLVLAYLVSLRDVPEGRMAGTKEDRTEALNAISRVSSGLN